MWIDRLLLAVGLVAGSAAQAADPAPTAAPDGPVLVLTVRQIAAADAPRVLRQLTAAPSTGTRIAVPSTSPHYAETSPTDITRATRYGTQQTPTDLATDGTEVLRVREGERVFLRVARSAPYVERIVHLAGERIGTVRGAAIQDVWTGFDLVGRMDGGEIRIDVTPRLLSLSNPALGQGDLSDLSTVVRVEPAVWSDLGARLAQANIVSQTVMESAGTASGEPQTLLLKAEAAPAR
jgi:hypothetical protein